MTAGKTAKLPTGKTPKLPAGVEEGKQMDGDVELPVVMNMACTHGIVPLPSGRSACVLLEHRDGTTRILDVITASVPNADAQAWLREQG